MALLDLSIITEKASSPASHTFLLVLIVIHLLLLFKVTKYFALFGSSSTAHTLISLIVAVIATLFPACFVGAALFVGAASGTSGGDTAIARLRASARADLFNDTFATGPGGCRFGVKPYGSGVSAPLFLPSSVVPSSAAFAVDRVFRFGVLGMKFEAVEVSAAGGASPFFLLLFLLHILK